MTSRKATPSILLSLPVPRGWVLAAMAVAALMAGGAAVVSADEERIQEFVSEIEIHPDGQLAVTETITVIAWGQKIRHGIFRDFPTFATTPFGFTRRFGFEVQEILRDGEKEPWSTTTIENGIRIYIGREGRRLPSKIYVYTIRYLTDRQLVMADEYDELYWNVTGNYWDFPIDSAKAIVRLPDGATVLSAEGYTGPVGGRGTNYRVVQDSGSEAILETTRMLLPGEGFTISVTWPKDWIDPAAKSDTTEILIRDNPYTIIGIAGIFMIFLYYIITWIFLGRDPPRGIIIPLYEPPLGFTPAAVRFLRGFGRVDNKSFAAAIIQLAVQGAVRISQEKQGFVLERIDEDVDLLPGQRRFLKALFAEGNRVVAGNSYQKNFEKAKEALEKWLKSDFERAYFVRNTGIWLLGMFLSLVPAGLAVLDARDLLSAGFILLWLTFWSIGVVALLSAFWSALQSGKPWQAIPTGLFALPFVGGWFFGVFFLSTVASLWLVAIFVSATFLNVLFYHLLKAPTLLGREILDQIEGFRHYLGVAERDRLNLEHPPERTPELFEKFLPYALALDVEQEWAEQFVTVLRVGEYQPRWTGGTDFARMGPTSFASALGGGMAGAIKTSSTSPSSSGSGGGGSSGGGGGGGGGGGW